MMMKTLSLAVLTALAVTGCASIHGALDGRPGKNPYQKKIFYTRYLTPSNPLDARIQRDLDQLRANPRAASVHNDLGMALVQKNFPNDAKLEFDRAIDSDRTFYPAWYNLGLLEASLGNSQAALRAFRGTIKHKPGHAAALFQMGLVEEQNRDFDAAIGHYAKAFSINHQLLDVRVNPRIVDCTLIDQALIRLYPTEHVRGSFIFQGAPRGYSDPTVTASDAASPQAPAADIVTPAPPTTAPAVQPVVPNSGTPPAPAPATTTTTPPSSAAVSVPRDTSPGKERVIDRPAAPNPDAWKAWEDSKKKKN
jgi:tetratricopeptide (TPR) repeat protein